MSKKFALIAGVLAFLLVSPALGPGDVVAADPDLDTGGPTPPRLSYVHGEASFWRPGAEDWGEAQLNTPLAAGDALATGSSGALELQVAPVGYVRAWANTELGLASREPGLVQLEVTEGQVSVDLRQVDPGQSVELTTPNAAVSIDRPGYYRAIVSGDSTTLIVHRGGPVAVTPTSERAVPVGPGEAVTVEGVEALRVTRGPAPPVDAWDRWNEARTDALVDSVSARYVSPGIYGVADLDHHGSWRTVESYGHVWVPAAVPAGWAPYSTGTWVWDPYYQWTWVDRAPWGWAPYHHGRWVFVSGYWAWAPGPIVARPVYAPALVAFFSPRVGVSIGVGAPAVSWVALGWGEPIIPWWGPRGFVGVPRWAGWGGPRVVNNVVVHRTTVVNVTQVRSFRNARVRDAVVAVPRDRFGRGPVRRVARVDPAELEPVRGQLDGPPARAPATGRGGRPAEPTRVAPSSPRDERSPHVSGAPADPERPAARRELRPPAPERSRELRSGPRDAERGAPAAPAPTQRLAPSSPRHEGSPGVTGAPADPERPAARRELRPPAPERSRELRSGSRDAERGAPVAPSPPQRPAPPAPRGGQGSSVSDPQSSPQSPAVRRDGRPPAPGPSRESRSGPRDAERGAVIAPSPAERSASPAARDGRGPGVSGPQSSPQSPAVRRESRPGPVPPRPAAGRAIPSAPPSRLAPAQSPRPTMGPPQPAPAASRPAPGGPVAPAQREAPAVAEPRGAPALSEPDQQERQRAGPRQQQRLPRSRR